MTNQAHGFRRRFFYRVKPLIPRWLQIALRRGLVKAQLTKHRDVWPIDERAGSKPEGWNGWAEGKQFAVVLTHDVDTGKGQNRVRELASLEMDLGFRSSFNFVPRRYSVSPDLQRFLVESGFEVGVHGLYHDGRYFESRQVWETRARAINEYLRDWKAVGFRSPSMHRELEWMHDLNILYDSSSFDTDPFEPYPEGVKTIFPFWVDNAAKGGGYVELPYTLPQDFTLFVLMGEKGIDIWKRKLDWIVAKGGMALINVHPDYMRFDGGRPELEEYPADIYKEMLAHVETNFRGAFWHALPREVAAWWAAEEPRGHNGARGAGA